MATLTRLARGGFGKKPALLVTQPPALMQRAAAARRRCWRPATPPGSATTSIWPSWSATSPSTAITAPRPSPSAASSPIRGGVIDVFPPGADEPVRLDLFGDTLETIRAFDRETQRSTRQLKPVDLLPVSEALLDADGVARFRTGYVAAFGAPGDDPLYATVSEGGAARRHGALAAAASIDSWRRLFDYLPDDALIALDHLAAEARDERLAMIADAYEARASADRKAHYRALPPSALYLTPTPSGTRRLAAHPARRFTPFQREDAGPGVVDMGAKLGRTFAAERAQDSVNLFEAAADHARRLIGDGQAGAVRLLVGRRVRAAGGHAGRPWPEGRRASRPTGRRPRRPIRRSRSASVLPLDAGFETDNLAVISETDILGDRLARPAPPPPRRQLPGRGHRARAGRPRRPHRPRHRPLRRPEDPGGAGRAARLPGDRTTPPTSKLYLPVENIDLLTRYGSDSRGRAARPAGRRGLAGAQGAGQGAPARDGRGPDRHRRRHAR